MRTDPTCVFCRIVAGEAPATVVWEWPDALAIVPLNPVTPGHILVLPRVHVPDFTTDPAVSGLTAQRAAELGRDLGLADANEITSRGPAATQTVWHLHRHLVPRTCGDGLPLPWTPQQDRDAA